MRVRSLSDLYHPSKAQLMDLQDQVERAERVARNESVVLLMLQQLAAVNLAGLFEREYRFQATRLWRLDLYCDSHRLGIELHGGIWVKGRHVQGIGFTQDRVKMNAAVEAGIRVLEYTAEHVKAGTALAQIERIIKQRG